MGLKILWEVIQSKWKVLDTRIYTTKRRGCGKNTIRECIRHLKWVIIQQVGCINKITHTSTLEEDRVRINIDCHNGYCDKVTVQTKELYKWKGLQLTKAEHNYLCQVVNKWISL